MPRSGAPLDRVERRQLRQMSGPRPERSVIRSATGRTRPEPSSWLARSLARTGRGRLESKLPSDCRRLAGPGRAWRAPRGLPGWLATTVEAVVTGVSEASLATLAETLDSRLDAAPPKLPGGSMKPQPDTMRATSENRPLRRTPRGGPGRNPGETTWTKRQLAHAQASGSVR